DLEVQFAHTGNQRLARIRVGVNLERRIFLRQFAQSRTHLLLVRFRLGLDGNRNDGSWKVHGFEHDRIAFDTDRVAGRDALQTDSRRNVAGAHLADLFALVGVHFEQPPDALAAVPARVINGVAVVDGHRYNRDDGRLTNECVGLD